MEQTGLLSLPEDVLIHIGHFLDLQSLLACSSSCQYLRRVLNYNGLWKKHCSRDFDFINKADCLVTPTFQYDGDYNLDRLCDERVNLLRQKHPLSNWREGRYVSHEVQTSDYLHPKGMMFNYNQRQIVFKDVYIFLHKKFMNEITIWNVEAVPYIYTSVRFAHYGRDGDLQYGIWYEILEDKLLVIQGNLVQVFHIQLPAKELPLEYLIYVNSDVAVKDFADNIYIDKCKSWIVGNRIISQMGLSPIWNIHIWDILTGTKVRTSEVPYTCRSLLLLCADDEDTFFLGLELRRNMNHIFRYCVSNNQYTLVINYNSTKGRPFLTMRYNNGLLFFFKRPRIGFIIKHDFNNLSVTKATFETFKCSNKFRICGDQLILATTYSIQVVDITSLQPLKIIKHWSSSFEFLPLFKFKVFITSCLGEVKLFDIDRENVVLLFKRSQEGHFSQNHCSLNQSCSKLILLSSRALAVYHFW